MHNGHDNATRLTLLIKLKSSDNEAAWSEFEQIYSPFIYNLVKRMGFQHHDSLDLSQAVLTKVWKKIETYNVDNKAGKFRGWLAVMTRNSVRDFIRTKKNFITSRDSVGYDDHLMNNLEKHHLPKIEELAHKEWVLYVTNLAKENILKDLHENKCRVFEMSVQGMSVKEIAEELEVTESLVYYHRQEVYDLMKQEIRRLNNEL